MECPFFVGFFMIVMLLVFLWSEFFCLLTFLKRCVYIGICDKMKSVCFATKTVMVRSGKIRPLIPVMNAQELQYEWSCLCQCIKVLVGVFFNPCFKLSGFLAPFLQTSAIVGYIIEGELLSLSLYMFYAFSAVCKIWGKKTLSATLFIKVTVLGDLWHNQLWQWRNQLRQYCKKDAIGWCLEHGFYYKYIKPFVDNAQYLCRVCCYWEQFILHWQCCFF